MLYLVQRGTGCFEWLGGKIPLNTLSIPYPKCWDQKCLKEMSYKDGTQVSIKFILILYIPYEHSLKVLFKFIKSGAGEMSQWLRTHTAPSQDQSSVPSIYIKFPASGEIQCPLLASTGNCMHVHMHTRTTTIKNEI